MSRAAGEETEKIGFVVGKKGEWRLSGGMRRYRCLSWVIWICLLWLSCLSPLSAEDGGASSQAKKAMVEGKVPGVGLAQGLTELTGVAISPMLGVSGVGVYRYWKTDVSMRGHLPWYAQPWAWGTGLVVVGLCCLKDVLGTMVPGVLKKPLDLVEMFESQVSALLVSGAFVPLLIRDMAEGMGGSMEVPVAALGMGGGEVAWWWLGVPLGVLVFGVVWLMFHALQVLLLISPFSSVDAFLKASRAGLLAMVGFLYVVAPWVAALFCVGLIGLAFWLAPRTLRLAWFGSRVGGDLVLGLRKGRRADLEEVCVVVAGSWSGLPARTMGRLVKGGEGGLVLRARRGWFGWKRVEIPLPEGEWMVERGVLMPSLMRLSGDEWMRMLWLLPRYRRRELELAESFGWRGVRDHVTKRGLAAAKAWLTGLFRFGDRSSLSTTKM